MSFVKRFRLVHVLLSSDEVHATVREVSAGGSGQLFRGGVRASPRRLLLNCVKTVKFEVCSFDSGLTAAIRNCGRKVSEVEMKLRLPGLDHDCSIQTT